MKACMILTGGETPPADCIRRIAEKSDMVIAADSGFDKAAALGIQPDLVVGDMDSLERKSDLALFPSQRIKRFPAEKDDTDTEIAYKTALEYGAGYVYIVGGGGGRIDHFLGILSMFERPVHPNEWYTAGEKILAVDGDIALHDMDGEIISLFPVGNETCRMTSRGLKWSLDDLIWKRGDTGISNVVITKDAGIQMRTGRLILICRIDREVS